MHIRIAFGRLRRHSARPLAVQSAPDRARMMILGVQIVAEAKYPGKVYLLCKTISFRWKSVIYTEQKALTILVMEKIIESFCKLLPYERWGFNKDTGESVSIILLLLCCWLIISCAKTIAKRRKKVAAALEDLAPQYDVASIKKAKRFYIATQYQNASPSRQDEPGFTHQYIARNKLIPFFIKIAFDQQKESERFYLILADSGMGKSTFMLHLFLQYHSFFNRRNNKKMRLLRFSEPDTINIIKSIDKSEAKKTVLLLDALDEDRGIVSRDPLVSDEDAFRSRIDEIIEITRSFAEVIITCRTQYFPGQEKDPYELSVRRPDEKGFYTFNKLYISPLTDKEVRMYLNKKYGRLFFINRKKKKKAAKIVSQAGNLLMRPMLLNYIDYLIEGSATYLNNTTIYETMVAKWLEREAEKRKITEERGAFINNLEKLSKKFAVALYTVWKEENRLSLSKEETLEVASSFNIQLESQEITGQSLLTCDGMGNWKFSHKSIMEYFLAKALCKDPRHLKNINFAGMDMAHSFYREMGSPFFSLPIIGGNETGLYFTPWYATEDFDWNALLPEAAYITSGSPFFYCERLNVKYGYDLVYDTEGNFQKSDINDIKGFRLLTEKEFESLKERLSLPIERFSNLRFKPDEEYVKVSHRSGKSYFRIVKTLKGNPEVSIIHHLDEMTDKMERVILDTKKEIMAPFEATILTHRDITSLKTRIVFKP